MTMDKYKIEKTKDGYAVKTRDYFWQKWQPVTSPDGTPVVEETLSGALQTIGSAWWKEFFIRVDSIGVF